MNLQTFGHFIAGLCVYAAMMTAIALWTIILTAPDV